MKPIFFANWKLHMNHKEISTWFDSFLSYPLSSDIILFPPVCYLDFCHNFIKNRPHLFLGAQDVSIYNSGAHTGNISAMMLKDLQASYVLVGHSELREQHPKDHTSAHIQQKIHNLYENHLIPILCIGENLHQRHRGETRSVLENQLNVLDFFKNIHTTKKSLPLYIAYEPTWAIGTGKTASPQEIYDVCDMIQEILLEKRYMNYSFVYGGSVSEMNVKPLWKERHKDLVGFLVGNASLHVHTFLNLL